MKVFEGEHQHSYSAYGERSGTNKHLEARRYYSGFEMAHDTYNALSCASDGNIYYVLSSESPHTGGKFFVYKPEHDRVEFIADLTEICGEDGLNAIPQGKSHVRFYERKGKLYFSTHVGYYEMIDGMDRLPKNPPDGRQKYPGGHFLAYDLKTKKTEDLAMVGGGEGIVSMTMDTDRGHIYGITWPTGHFVHYDLEKNSLYDLGPVSAMGEAGVPGEDFRSLCRALFVDPADGKVYFSTAEGDIFHYCPVSGKMELEKEIDLRLDYFGQYDPTVPGSMAYNWRMVCWHEPEAVAYGVHGNSGYLFRFDPRRKQIEIVQRITSLPSQRSGMFDQFSYGYLGFGIAPHTHTVYYLTGGPIYENGKRVGGVERIAKGAARGMENLHLVTFDLLNRHYIDHGPIRYTDGSIPTYVNSIAIGQDGYVYALARFAHKGKVIQDLISIPDPLKD
ncbi:hypothetical protein [Negadavirga shengliensis]|uniref:Uncharacterized protein n=1 Tax=Negadavirga shengliensis TaxID=1389218 RepID=A0ABV9T7Y3_9BACT